MGNNGVAEQLGEDVVDGPVVAHGLVGHDARKGVAPGGEPRSELVELDVAPGGVDDVVVAVHGVDDAPQAIARRILVVGLDTRVVAELDFGAALGDVGQVAEPLEQGLGVRLLDLEPVVGGGAQQLDQGRPDFGDRAGRADAHVAPPLEEADAFVELHAPGELVAVASAAGDEVGVARDRGHAAGAILLQDDLIAVLRGLQHRDQVVVQLGLDEVEFDRACGDRPRRAGVARFGIAVEAAQQFVDLLAVGGLRLDDEGQVDVLALDFVVAAHVAAQAGALGERSGFGRRENREPVSLGLATDNTSDVTGLFTNHPGRVRLGLDPVDELSEAAVGAAQGGDRGEPVGNYMIHHDFLPFSAILK